MAIRRAVSGDRLVLVNEEGRSFSLIRRRILVPQNGDKIEVIVGGGVVTEIEYLAVNLRWGIIPRRIKEIKEAVFFYDDSGNPQVWINEGLQKIPLQKFPVGTKFSVTDRRRAFKSDIDSSWEKFWMLIWEPPPNCKPLGGGKSL